MTEIYREFPYYRNKKIEGFNGTIRIDVLKNHLNITISNFYHCQLNIRLIVKYYDNQREHLFEIIKNILDKITQTMYYDNFDSLSYTIQNRSVMENEPYIEGENSSPTEPNDFILYDRRGKPKQTDWNAPDSNIHCSGLYWMPFTKENMKFIELIDDTDHVFKTHEQLEIDYPSDEDDYKSDDNDSDDNDSEDESSGYYCETKNHYYHLFCEIGENCEFNDTEFKEYVWTKYLEPTAWNSYLSYDENDSEYNSDEESIISRTDGDTLK